ncbi:MAG: valine--tRNA ligase [Bacteroidetes bacterium]|nr:valine--tRNA ligase [Bacteroidota bacterium]
MASPKNYVPAERENHWYDYWMKNDVFSSKPDNREPFTILIPPPNVTGVLHMGHTLNNTIQDILIRKARMEGKNACWVPGTDHASIATEAKVVALLREQGIDKFEIGREKFLEHAHQWKDKYGGIILQQLRKLGVSCDWNREAFTMDEIRYQGVIDVFNRLYNKGLIYRGVRMINWDPKAKTAVSDEEVYHEERTDKLYYVAYKIVGSNDTLTIATTRPETIMADTAICINPNDERFVHLHGKKAIVPLVNREIPIILDEYVDMEFGTGCLKVTPAHDINDYNLGLAHNLPVIDILNDDGTLNEKAEYFVGEDREIARTKVADKLQEIGQLTKTEPYEHKVGKSERSGAVIEPKLSLQWFCKMEDLAKPALDAVMNDEVQFHPAKFKNTYRHWMENVRDWCVSRQLWWGHRIPAWHLPNGEFVVAMNENEALEKAQSINANWTMADLHQDEDVLDTWFSSWLWPMSVFDGIANPDNDEIKYYYPADVIVTAPDIIFFWIARMIMAGFEYRGEKPFKHVYFTGLVRDKLGRKMSKQLGNSPDLFKLIEQYGADSVRFGILISSPAGNDLLFDEKLCEQGSQFINKIWNAFKLIETWTDFDKIVDDAPDWIVKRNKQALQLFNDRLNVALQEIDSAYGDYKISEGLQITYRTIWNDFCSNLLEWVKPKKDTVIDRTTYEQVISHFESCLRILHPFMPFATEEIYHLLRKRADGETISTSAYPNLEKASEANYKKADELISAIRNYRTKNNIVPKHTISFVVKSQDEAFYKSFSELLKSAANLESVELADETPERRNSFLVGTDQLFDLSTSTSINDNEKAELKDEAKRLKEFIMGIEKKLQNEKFVNGAPEQVVAMERKKLADSQEKLEAITQKLNG